MENVKICENAGGKKVWKNLYRFYYIILCTYATYDHRRNEHNGWDEMGQWGEFN